LHSERLSLRSLPSSLAPQRSSFGARATRDLVESAEITAKRQLSAYIGHQPNGCIWFPRLPDGVGFKYAEMNHGKTPAYDVELNVRLTETAPDDRYGGPFCRLPVMKMIHPKQEIGTAIFIRSITDIHPFRPDRVFFLYGYVDYKDCFEQKWRRRFAFRHNAVVLGMGYEEWDARPDHNDEFKREGDGPWPT
jgi:hypothetical protein